MTTPHPNSMLPAGGLAASGDFAVRRWRWTEHGGLATAPVRCRRDQWYLVRAWLANGGLELASGLPTHFLGASENARHGIVPLQSTTTNPGQELLGWVQAPPDATHVQLVFANMDQARCFRRISLHAVADRDPKCHPLANVPRWTAYQPPFEIDRIFLPKSLDSLSAVLGGERRLEIRSRPRSLAELTRTVKRAALIVDPAWIRDFGWTWSDLEAIAQEAWVLMDLESTARLLRNGREAETHVREHEADHEISSARVDYSDVQTRGFALQDVFPFGTRTEEGGFSLRTLTSTRSWKQFAARSGISVLLSNESPVSRLCGNVLSAAKHTPHGRLLMTDVPWIATLSDEALLAPRLTRHLVRTHLGADVDDGVQYSNRWDEDFVVLRDIAEMPRRYAPLHAVRWASDELARLGLTLLPGGRPVTRHVLIRTGRIDTVDTAAGIAPEPMMMFMKWLAREAREKTAWFVQHAMDAMVTWQFEAKADIKYVALYASASELPDFPIHSIRLCTSVSEAAAIAVPAMRGILGDGSLEFQAELTRTLSAAIAEAGMTTTGRRR